MKRALIISAMLAFCATGGAVAGAGEDANNFMQIHKIEIAFHEAGSTKNLDLMMSLFTDDATLTAAGNGGSEWGKAPNVGTNRPGMKAYFLKSLRIGFNAACLFRLDWTSTPRTSPSASTARQR